MFHPIAVDLRPEYAAVAFRLMEDGGVERLHAFVPSGWEDMGAFYFDPEVLRGNLGCAKNDERYEPA